MAAASTPPVTPATTPPAPAPKPAASLADVYDIGHDDIVEDTEQASPVEPVVSESPPAQPRNPDNGQFVAKTHPRYLTRQAKDLGFTDADLAEMDTDALGEAVAASARLERESRRAEPKTPETANTPDEGIDWGTDEAGVKMKEADYAPALAKAIKSSHAQQQRIDRLEGIVKQLMDREGMREANTHFDRIDQAFARLTDLSGLLGTGSRHDLDANGPEMARRMAILEVARRMAGDKATLDQQLSKVGVAAKTLFASVPAPTPTPPEESPEITLERWNGAATARPTHRQGSPEAKGTTRAVKAVAQLMKERGQLGEEVTDADFPK